MWTHTEIAEKIKQKHADHTLAVKENPKNFYKETSRYFGDDELLKEIKCSDSYKVIKEKSHSQTETVEYCQCNKPRYMQEYRNGM